EEQTLLIAGAKANVVTGTIGGVEMSQLTFFDIGDVTLTTGSADDEIVIGEGGISAYGMKNFTLDTGEGDDTVTVLSDKLTPPAVGTFVPTGEILPDGTVVHEEILGAFLIKAGAGANRLNVSYDTDWTVDGTTITARSGSRVELEDVQTLNLSGGAGVNRISVINWAGTAVVDGLGGSDQISVALAALEHVDVKDTGTGAGDLDQLTVVGNAAANHFMVNESHVLVDDLRLDYSGME